MSARRTERLLNLVIALRATSRPLVKEEIRRAVPQYDECDTVEAFDRMFERDKEELRDLGVPVVAQQRSSLFEDEIGYRIDAGAYALPQIHFTPAELAVLNLAGRAWQQARLSGAAGRGLTKLRALGEQSGDDAALGEAMLGIEPRVSASEPAFAALYEATRDQRPVTFSYQASGAATSSKRRLEPWRLTSWHGHWYVIGHDLDRGERRVFRISRIKGRVAIAQEKRNTHPAPQGLDAGAVIATMFPEEPEIDVVVELAPGRGNLLRRLGTVDGDLVTVRGRASLMADEFAALGGDARVVSPPQVADRVRDLLTGARDAHAERLAREGDAPVLDPAPTPSPTPRTRTQSGDRLSRLLAMIPFLLARQGIPTKEAAAHFGITEAELVKDLQLAFLCGLPGHLPDDLIEAEWESGRVYLRNADAIAQPLRLGVDEAISLIVGLRMLADVPGGGDDVVASALAKLTEASAEAAMAAASVHVSVETSPDEARLLEMLRGAVADHREVHLRYLVPTRDEATERDVAPMRVLALEGRWYLEAWCRRVEAVRTFRLDRIERAHLTGADGTPPPEAVKQSGDDVFQPAPEHLTVTIELKPGARWIVEYYWAQVLADGDDGSARVQVRTGEPQLVIRLALRLGGQAVVTHPRELAQAVVDEANRAL